MKAPLPDPWRTPLAELDVSDVRLYTHDAWRPYFARLRAECPVHFLADSPFGPFWSVTRFEDIVAVDSNHEVFSSVPSVMIGQLGDTSPLASFIAADPPRHDIQRRAVQPTVAPKNLARMESLIRSRVENILDGLPVGETFDWVERVSVNITTQMLATLFDFPFEDRSKLTYWSDIATAAPGMAGGNMDEEERRAGLGDCLHTFLAIWEQRRSTPGGFDLISRLQADPGTAAMAEDHFEFLGNLLLLIVGGNDTTRNSISGGVIALNQFPDEYDKLRADHGLIPGMVSEIIRWQTPLAHMRRLAKVDTVLGGQPIRRGDKVVMWYISGNRDDSVIADADAFLIDRDNIRHHASFGFGIHRCMGNRLAEMQLRIVWEEIMQRFRLVEQVGEPGRVQSNFVHGYTSLPVKVHPH